MNTPEKQGLPLLELSTAYKSLRDSGFDFPTAIGELIDNSVQANAARIDIHVRTEKSKVTKKSKAKANEKSNEIDTITQVAVIDNGEGMDKNRLHACSQLGYSSRYNDRSGFGRFGVGATLAAISQCKRITICSRLKSESDFLATYIDLDEIANGQQIDIPEPSNSLLPLSIRSLMLDDSNTVVIWDKCDRLQKNANGNFIQADGNDGLIQELRLWIARAFRHIIWGGVDIFINNEKIISHDPLYLYPERTQFPNDPPATIVFEHHFDWDIPNIPDKKSTISITLTLLPPELRPERGAGGYPPAKERRIPENEGLSVLRHKREVAFGNFYPIVPSVDFLDRWWGCEINFEPELDECWEVRNVKRGVRPIAELREALKQILSNKILKLRKDVQDYWKEVDARNAETKGSHSPAEDIVKEVESQLKPSFQAGVELSTEEKQNRKEAAVQDPDLTSIEKEILNTKILGPNPLPISIKSKAMAGAEFMETDHVGDGQIILTFNKNHPFFSEVYSKIEELEKNSNESTRDIAVQVRYAIDLLLMAYGRAESMINIDAPIINEAITELRSYWGVQLRKYINKLTSDRN